MKPLILKTLVSSFAALMMSSNCFANGPWQYIEGQGAIGIAFVEDSYERAWIQGSAAFATLDVNQKNTWIWAQYGLRDNLTVSAQIGYTESSNAATTYEYFGLADSRIDLQYQIINEWENSPVTANIKTALIIAGNYERAAGGRPHSPGDKGDGFEIGAQVGRFVHPNLSLWSDAGYRIMSDDVPDSTFFSLGGSAYYSIFNFDIAWKTKKSRGGLDIALPGFSPDLFHEVNEQREWTEWNIGVTPIEQFSLGLTYAKVLTGRNTSDSEIYSVALGYSF